MAAKSGFKVIIVGGGIGGLALANSLQHAGIDYALVEKRERLDPQQGASIGILPNGARILDQLGCYGDLEELTVSMETSATRREDGSLIGEPSDALKLMELRTGYPVFFLDRQLLLRVLADRIQDHSKILLRTRFESIEQSSDKVVVRCKDGSSIEGDIVVGADGSYSPVRREMWRHAELADDGERFEEDKTVMSAEYKCIFGISEPIPGMNPGQTDRTYAKDMSTLSYVGKGGRVFWFVFVKMDKVYREPDIPRFDDDDVAALLDDIGSLAIRENSNVTVRKLHDANVACNLVSIEEAEYKHWSYGRIVCIGDSVHKMTPNLGAGASSAIESASTLSNVLVGLVSKSQHPSLSAIDDTFKEYQKARTVRITRTMNFSNNLTRVQALKGTKERIYTHHVAPRMDDFAAEMFSSFVIGASIIDHLPVPARSTQGTMPFNPKQGWGFEELKSSRVKRALPLLALGFYCLWCTPRNILDSFSALNPPRNTTDTLSVMNNVDTSTKARDIITSGPVFPIHTDIAYGIWLLEAARLNNKLSFVQFPIIFGLALQWLGINVVAPLYFFLLYIQSPIESFRASDNRLTDVSYTSTAGPLILLFGILPKCLQHRSVELAGFSGWQQVSNAQPYALSAAQFLLAHSLVPSTVRHDRLWAVRRDVPWIRASVGALVAASAYFWLDAALLRPDSPSSAWTFAAATLLFSDAAYFAAAVAMWLALAFRDLREAGMLAAGWFTFAVGCAATLACVGPGGLLAIGWLVREEVLLRRRHESAITEGQEIKQ